MDAVAPSMSWNDRTWMRLGRHRRSGNCGTSGRESPEGSQKRIWVGVAAVVNHQTVEPVGSKRLTEEIRGVIGGVWGCHGLSGSLSRVQLDSLPLPPPTSEPGGAIRIEYTGCLTRGTCHSCSYRAATLSPSCSRSERHASGIRGAARPSIAHWFEG